MALLVLSLLGSSCGRFEGQQGPPNEVQIQLLSFGAGNTARPNAWVGLHLRVTDPSAVARDIMLRCEVDDPDGDRVGYTTVLTADPLGAEAWLPIRTNRALRANQVFRVVASVAEPDPLAPGGFSPGRPLGELVFSPASDPSGSRPAATIVPEYAELIGLIGARDIGLTPYSAVFNTSVADWPPFGHEAVAFANLREQTIPSNWLGLDMLGTLIWRAGDPMAVSSASARAIIDWVRRGGSLIVMLPSDAQGWTDAQSNPLASTIPPVRITQRRGAPGDLSPLLGRSASPSFNGYALQPLPGVSPTDAMPILHDRDGEPVVVRRLLGSGSVTLVGVDPAGAQTERFWHRVLGRRGVVATPGEASQIASQQNIQNLAMRTPTWIEDWISQQINRSGRAAAGLAFAVLVFGAFWLIAGPIGHVVLRKKKAVRHAWLVFLIVSLLFALGSWTGAAALRPGKTDAVHVTILTEVYDRPTQRARMWLSLLTPAYGDMTLRLAPSSQEAGSPTGSISPWAPREDSTPSFPDRRAYTVDTDAPSVVTFPIRATAKQFTASWAGPPSRTLRMPRPVLAPGERGEPRISMDARGVTGSLQHGLPSTLQNTRVILIGRQRAITPANTTDPGADVNSPLPIATGQVIALGDWEPGTRLDLAPYFRFPLNAESLAMDLNALTPRVSGGLTVDISDIAENRALMLTLFPHIGPPTPTNFGSINGPAICRRIETLGDDLGVWLTQPCLIVVGELVGEQSPVPLEISTGGEFSTLPTSGRTIIRWVYPLEPNPPAWPGQR